MTFTPKVGMRVEYRGYSGELRIIDDVYLTICTKNKTEGMIGDVCMLVYPKFWDLITVLEPIQL